MKLKRNSFYIYSRLSFLFGFLRIYRIRAVQAIKSEQSLIMQAPEHSCVNQVTLELDVSGLRFLSRPVCGADQHVPAALQAGKRWKDTTHDTKSWGNSLT